MYKASSGVFMSVNTQLAILRSTTVLRSSLIYQMPQVYEKDIKSYWVSGSLGESHSFTLGQKFLKM